MASCVSIPIALWCLGLVFSNAFGNGKWEIAPATVSVGRLPKTHFMPKRNLKTSHVHTARNPKKKEYKNQKIKRDPAEPNE